MILATAIVIIALLIGLVLTLLVIGKGDSDYSSKSKDNVSRLSLIYVVTILGSFIAVAVFIYS